MQRWTCSVCGEVFLVNKNNPDDKNIKEAVAHMMSHTKDELEKKEYLMKFISEVLNTWRKSSLN